MSCQEATTTSKCCESNNLDIYTKLVITSGRFSLRKFPFLNERFFLFESLLEKTFIQLSRHFVNLQILKSTDLFLKVIPNTIPD